jgi:hypothetical protein
MMKVRSKVYDVRGVSDEEVSTGGSPVAHPPPRVWNFGVSAFAISVLKRGFTV